MSPPPVHVFISSTWLDLQPEREAVEAALQRMRETKYAGMEYFGSRDEDTRSTSLAEVDSSQVYVGIFGGRYGSGITEAEYRRARERKLPCFLYVKDEGCITSDEREADADKNHRLMALKDELRRNHTITKFANPHDLAAKVTADLHRWLFDEYLAPQLEGAAQGQLPRDQTQSILGAIKDFGMLNQALREKLERVGFVVAGGKGSIARGESVYDSILITGDWQCCLSNHRSAYPALKDYALDFSDAFNSIRGFVGREFIFQRLQEFQQRNPCGYLRVVADAGLGKTALAAEVARRLNAVAFFANASRGLTRTDQCLNHLAVELIARFGLAHDHLPARAGEDSAFLGRVLAEAAAKVGGPLWLVVDALDESDPLGPGRNPLLLPDRLPRRVFMLVTHRPGDISIATDTGTANEEYRIASNDTTQQDDIAIYLRQVAERPEIRRAREATNPRITVDRFVSVLQQKSEGNFKYLDYVLADIAAREPGFDPLDLNALPSGLPGYYEQFWRQMEQVRDQEGWADWNGLYRPVIACLAAAREPVPAAWLAAILGRPSEEIEERALRRWRRFLGQEGKGDSERWRVVHQVFRRFPGRAPKGRPSCGPRPDRNLLLELPGADWRPGYLGCMIW